MRVPTRVLTVAAVLSAALLLVPKAATAQTLGEVAEKEKERRKKEKPAKVYTEGDLKKGGGNVSVVGPASTTSEAKPAEGAEGAAKEKEKTDDEKKAEQAKAWREKLDEARANVTRLSAEVTKLQTDANDLSGPLYSSIRTSLLNRLEEAKKLLAAAQQSVTDLEEEGRRNGYR